MESYPVTLPCPLLAGNSNGTSTTFRRSTTTFNKQQRRFSRGSYTTTFSAIMTTTELQEFRTWYLTSINEMDIFEAEWEVEGESDIKKFKFLESYNVSSYEYDLHHISAPIQMMSNISSSITKVNKVTDFNATDDEQEQITYTWTDDVLTRQYDLYKNDVLYISDISSGYTEYTSIFGVTNSYKLKQIYLGGKLFSNSDNGSCIASLYHHFIFNTDLSGPISITCLGDDFEISDNDGPYIMYPSGTVSINNIGIMRVRLGNNSVSFKFDLGTEHRLLDFTILDLSNNNKFTSFSGCFEDCINLSSFNVSDPDSTINITDIDSMFTYCYSLNSIPLFNTSNVRDFSVAFAYVPITSLPAFDTSEGQTFTSMFLSCQSLVCLNNIDTTNQTSTLNMFYDCPSLVTPDATDKTAIEAGTNWTNPGSCP